MQALSACVAAVSGSQGGRARPSEPVSALIQIVPAVRRATAQLSDAELVQALLDEELGAPRVAVERLGPMIRGVLRRGLGNDAEVDDAFQEVFICLFRRIATLREPDSLRPFVLAIAVNIVLHERRRRQKRALLSFDHELTTVGPAGASEEAPANYALARLTELMQRLTPRDRTTFVMRYVEGRTAIEVAEHLGVSEPTARRSFTRASRRIRKWAACDPFLADYLVRDWLPPTIEDD